MRFNYIVIVVVWIYVCVCVCCVWLVEHSEWQIQFQQVDCVFDLDFRGNEVMQKWTTKKNNNTFEEILYESTHISRSSITWCLITLQIDLDDFKINLKTLTNHQLKQKYTQTNKQTNKPYSNDLAIKRPKLEKNWISHFLFRFLEIFRIDYDYYYCIYFFHTKNGKNFVANAYVSMKFKLCRNISATK